MNRRTLLRSLAVSAIGTAAVTASHVSPTPSEGASELDFLTHETEILTKPTFEGHKLSGYVIEYANGTVSTYLPQEIHGRPAVVTSHGAMEIVRHGSEYRLRQFARHPRRKDCAGLQTDRVTDAEGLQRHKEYLLRDIAVIDYVQKRDGKTASLIAAEEKKRAEYQAQFEAQMKHLRPFIEELEKKMDRQMAAIDLPRLAKIRGLE